VGVKIEMFPALGGDSFLVQCGGEKKVNILIDTGYASTYDRYLKERLISLKKQGECLSLLVSTHIDGDHIRGGIKLLQENGSHLESKIIEIKSVWHNGYQHCCFKKKQIQELNAVESEIISSISRKGYPINKTLQEGVEEPITAEEGNTLSSLLLKGGYSWNREFNGGAVYIGSNNTIKLDEDVIITLLSPTKEKLQKLEKFWEDEIYRKGFTEDPGENKQFNDAFEFLASNELLLPQDGQIPLSSLDLNVEALLEEKFSEDNSSTNGSSIAFILESGGKRVLFLGDSHPSVIKNFLEKDAENPTPVWFDAIKVSHHGSKSNTNSDLLALVESKYYLFWDLSYSHKSK